MAEKIYTTDLRVGMFVAELDRPWVDTPFLLQGFLIEDDHQIRALKSHCEYVIVDRARSIGAQFKAAPLDTIPLSRRAPIPVVAQASVERVPDGAVKPTPVDDEPQVIRPATPVAGAPGLSRVIKLEDIPPYVPPSEEGSAAAAGGGFFGRLIGRMFGSGARAQPGAKPGKPIVEEQRETREEFEARAAFIPAGLEVQSYRDVVTVEQEVPRAREVVAEASDVLQRLVADLKERGSFEVERVEEIVADMVDSIVRNPDALMWVARLREQDMSTYGHGLQVSVYLSAFGRQLGFPKPQLALLAQIGLFLDIGKIKLSKALLEKAGRLTTEEFEAVKKHVDLGVEILTNTADIDPQVIEATLQHHERLNGSGYPQGLQGEEISIYGRMAGIVDCFAALIKHRPYAEAVSSYEALRSLTGWAGEFFQEALVQQFVSSVGVFPVGSLIELSTGEVAIVVAHNKVRRLKPRVLVVTGPDKTPAPYPTMLDLLYDARFGGDEPPFIKRGLPSGAYGLDLRDFYLS